MPRSLQKEIIICAPIEKVFAFMDDLSKTGMHMSQNSTMMMGSKLGLERLPSPENGVGATYRWKGKVMGFSLDFTETVTHWVENSEKIWETIGSPQMIILGWYRMHLKTVPIEKGTLVSLEIQYTRPENLFYRFLSFLLAGWYAKWCLDRMLFDSKAALEKTGNG